MSVCYTSSTISFYFWMPSMKNIILNIFKNLTVKGCKIWCNDVYMSILLCDIFWWKLIDRNLFSPFVCSFHCFARDYPQTGYSYTVCQIFHIYSTTTLSSVLKPKYFVSIRNKCVYLLESSETSITIWRQEYIQNCYIQHVL